jgi:hypothetical protein
VARATAGSNNLFSSPKFMRVKEVLQRLHPKVGKPVFALGTVLRSLGLPSGRQHLILPPVEAARRLTWPFGGNARGAGIWRLDLADIQLDLRSWTAQGQLRRLEMSRVHKRTFRMAATRQIGWPAKRFRLG